MRVGGGIRVARSLLLALLLLGTWLSHEARANDFEEFETARSAYESQDYARAVALFENLAGGDTPQLTNRSLVLESKKYLGAGYLFLGKMDAAEREFERLLRLDPQYMLDPLGFPEEVQRLFARVKTRLDAERKLAEDERRREDERMRSAESQRGAQEQSRWVRLTQLAETETVHEERSRWIGLLPFGVGQFQNGHLSLGAILAVSEGSLFAIAFVSWVVHENLRGQTPAASERDEFNLTERVTRYTNRIALALFGVVAVTGVIDAQLRFQGSRVYERKRTLPTDLYGGPQVSIGPGSVSLTVRF